MSNEPQKMKIIDWIGVILAVLYTISPIDIIPDVAPVIGWIDDMFIVLTNALNLLQKTIGQTIPILGSLFKISKIVLLFLGIIIILLIILLGTTILSLIGK